MTEETNTEVQEVPQVTAGDLALMVKIIDAGSERGAWKGEELGTIGAVRTKMVAIVQSVAPVTDEATAEEGEVDEATVETAAAVVDTEDKPKPKRKRGSAA